jgi:hypothetical protein
MHDNFSRICITGSSRCHGWPFCAQPLMGTSSDQMSEAGKMMHDEKLLRPSHIVVPYICKIESALSLCIFLCLRDRCSKKKRKKNRMFYHPTKISLLRWNLTFECGTALQGILRRSFDGVGACEMGQGESTTVSSTCACCASACI